MVGGAGDSVDAAGAGEELVEAGLEEAAVLGRGLGAGVFYSFYSVYGFGAGCLWGGVGVGEVREALVGAEAELVAAEGVAEVAEALGEGVESGADVLEVGGEVVNFVLEVGGEEGERAAD